MKRQRNEKPIDEELLMRMMAGEAAGTGEPGTGKEETAVPVEKPWLYQRESPHML